MKTPALLKAFIPVHTLHFSSPEPPKSDPKIEEDRKRREKAAKRERIEQARTRAKQAGGRKARKSLFSGGMTGFTARISPDEETGTLG